MHQRQLQCESSSSAAFSCELSSINPFSLVHCGAGALSSRPAEPGSPTQADSVPQWCVRKVCGINGSKKTQPGQEGRPVSGADSANQQLWGCPLAERELSIKSSRGGLSVIASV